MHIQEAMGEAPHSVHSPNASLGTPPAATGGGVPLHVRIVIVISIALLIVNATLLIIKVGATIDSHAQYARSYDTKCSLCSFQSGTPPANPASAFICLPVRLDISSRIT